VRSEILLSRKLKDGSTERDHLLAAARKGNESAQEDLHVPDAPETLAYLIEWAFILCGRSGASMDGLAPLSFTTIESWSRLTGIYPDPLEVKALIELDAVIRKPERDEPEKVVEEKAETPWPETK